MKRTIHINIPFHKKQDTSYPSYQQLEEEFSSLQDLNFPESALAAEYGLVELSILPLQVFPSLFNTYHYHFNCYHNYCYHHDNFCRARPLWTTFCARACLSHCSSSRRQIWRCPWSSFVHWALSLFLYNYFHNLIYIRCHPSPCPTAWTAYPCPFPFHQVILILIAFN